MYLCYNSSMLVLKKQNQKGFTLVELLVTISIFAILTGVVVFNQGKFNSTILLTNLAYDTALTIRQAQNYGINVKEFDNNGNNFLPYGVHFAVDDSSTPNYDESKSFILFADTSYSNAGYTGDGMYTLPVDNEINLSICQTDKGCVKRYNIKSGNYIKDICAGTATDGACTNPDESSEVVDIVFKRPNPDALIRFNPTGDKAPLVTIILSSGDDGNTKEVTVQSNGLIQVGD